jgi:hypothetical protein
MQDYLARRSAKMSGDEIVRTEQEKIKRLIALGLGRYEAVQAVDSGLDLPAEPLHQEPAPQSALADGARLAA